MHIGSFKACSCLLCFCYSVSLDIVPLAFQVNGGEVPEKVEYAYSLFESAVRINGVFSPNEMIDTIAVTKGRGREGVVTRWGVTRLPRKTHRGLRKVRQSGLVAF